MKAPPYSPYIFLVLVLALKKPRSADYVMIEYGGMPRDKTVLTVVFTIDNFESEFGLTSAIKIDKCEYLSVCDVIRQHSGVMKLDTTETAFYKFWIVRNKKKELFGAFSFDATKSVFDEITEQIKNRRRKSKVSETFQDILRQIR